MQEKTKAGGNAGPVKPDIKKQPQNVPVKKRKKISFAAVFCILLVLLIAGAGAAVYFDLGGIKGSVISALQTPSPEPTATPSPTADPQAVALEQQRKALLDREQEVSAKEKDISAKEQQVALREAAVTEAENAQSAAAQGEASIKATAKIYENMDVAKAAAAISGLKTVEEMANILSHMASDKAAKIMEQMKPALVTKISSQMLK